MRFSFVELLEGKKDRLFKVLTNQLDYPQAVASWACNTYGKFAIFVAKAMFSPHTWTKTAIRERETYMNKAAANFNPEDKGAQASEIVDEQLEQMAADALKSDLPDRQYLISRINHVIEKLFSNQDKPKLQINPNDLTLLKGEELVSQLNYIQDWAVNANRENPGSVVLPRLLWEEACAAAESWHEEQARNASAGKTALTLQSDEEVVIQFDRQGNIISNNDPHPAFRWVDLRTNYSRAEADAMGHCGRANRGTLFSLRDHRWVPHITADIDRRGHICGQVYGRGNKRPIPTYHRMILDLIGTFRLEKLIPERYGEGSLSLDDLSKEDKQWFEEKYGYELEGTASKKDIEEADRMINGFNGKWFSLSADNSYADGDYLSANWYLDLNLESMGLTLNDDLIQYGRLKDFKLRQELSRRISIDYPGNLDEQDFEDGRFRYYGSFDYFDTQRDNSSPQNWAQNIIDEAERCDDRISDSVGGIIQTLTDLGIVQPNALTQLIKYAESDLTFIDHNTIEISTHLKIPNLKDSIDRKFRLSSTNTSGVSIYGTRNDSYIEDFKTACVKIKNRLNKAGIIDSLVSSPKKRPSPSNTQMTFNFDESSALGQHGKFVVSAVRDWAIILTLTINLSNTDEAQLKEAKRKLARLNKNQEKIADYLSLWLFGEPWAQKQVGKFIKTLK